MQNEQHVLHFAHNLSAMGIRDYCKLLLIEELHRIERSEISKLVTSTDLHAIRMH